MKVRYTICHLGSIIIFRAYCVGKVDKIYLHVGSIMIIIAYCVFKSHNMLP